MHFNMSKTEANLGRLNVAWNESAEREVTEKERES